MSSTANFKTGTFSRFWLGPNQTSRRSVEKSHAQIQIDEKESNVKLCEPLESHVLQNLVESNPRGHRSPNESHLANMDARWRQPSGLPGPRSLKITPPGGRPWGPTGPTRNMDAIGNLSGRCKPCPTRECLEPVAGGLLAMVPRRAARKTR